MLADYYEITVEGHLNRAHWQRWFGVMQVTPEDGGIHKIGWTGRGPG